MCVLKCIHQWGCLRVSVSFFPAGRQVNEGEDVVLDEAGEAQEDGVQEETHQAQTSVQGPLVEMDSQNLDRQKKGGWTEGLEHSSRSGMSHI